MTTATATADRVAQSDAARGLGRWGIAARGAVYLVMGALALRLASGDGGETADREGALHAVVRQPFGRWLLGALCVGFATYAAYRFLRAATGRSEDRTGERDGPFVRLGNVGIGLLYVALFVSSASLVLHDSTGGSSEQSQRGWTARLLAHAWGEWLVALVGIGVVVAGVVMIVMGVREDFAGKLDAVRMRPWQRTWLPRLGVFGWVARGVVFGVIGVFLVRAALDHDPNESVGIDGALHRLASAPFGVVLLAVVALGFAAYGAYSLVEARWRRVLQR
jgi:hypothetical protein